MQQLISYLLTSGVALGLFYVVYRFCLKGQVYFALNRIMILLFLCLAFLIPFLEFEWKAVSEIIPHQSLKVLVISSSGAIPQNTETAIHWNIFLIIYISGVLLLSVYFIYSLARLVFLYLRSSKIYFGGFTTILIKDDQSPFTFFNLLFISEEDYQKGEDSEFLIHEKVHRDHLHSFDMVLVEIFTIIHWFNPFMWLLRKALVDEHEFMADQLVLKKGFDLLSYQKLLFERSTGVLLEMANHFNYSPLKQRLKMMTVEKSLSLVDKIKYILTIPMMCTIVFVFMLQVPSLAQDKDIYSEVDEFPEYPGGKEAMYKSIASNIKYPEKARKIGVEARVFVSFVVNTDGKVEDVKTMKKDLLKNTLDEIVVVGYDKSSTDYSVEIHQAMKLINSEAIRAVSQLGNFTPGQKNGKKVKTKVVLPVNFILNNKGKK